MTTRLATIASLALAASAALLQGCSSSASTTLTYDAPMAKPIAVDIVNARGDITVRGDGKPGMITVAASRWIPDDDEQPADGSTHRDDRWNENDLSVDLVEQEGGAVLVVRSGENNEELGIEIDMEITLPSLDGTLIRNAHGTVVLVDFAGVTRVHNQFGPVDVRTARPISEEVTLTTTDGSVWLQVPTESRGDVDLRTLDGIAALRDKTGGANGSHAADSESVTGFLTTGGPQIVARTDEGNVELWVMDDPHSYTRVVRPTLRNPIYYLWKGGSRRYTRELPEDHPSITGYKDPSTVDAY